MFEKKNTPRQYTIRASIPVLDASTVLLVLSGCGTLTLTLTPTKSGATPWQAWSKHLGKPLGYKDFGWGRGSNNAKKNKIHDKK